MSRTLVSSRQKRKVYVPNGRKLSKLEAFNLAGLDLVTPHDAMDNAKSPTLYNCRIQEQDSTGTARRVAIRTRKGPGFYTVPVGETIDTSQTSTTGASDQPINTVHWTGQPFVPSVDGRLTKIDARFKNPDGTIGSVILEVRADDGGVPGDIIATSSTQGSSITDSYSYISFRFIEAPLLTNGTTYWLVAHLQNGGVGEYNWSGTTNTTTALHTDNAGGSWVALGASVNFKTYLSTAGGVKGLGRYYPTSGSNTTLFAHGTVVYKTTDSTGAVTSIKTGLSSSATDYHFAQSQDKMYWVNGLNNPMVYDGASVVDVSGSPSVSNLLVFHKNRLFLQPASDPTRIEFSELGDYSTYGATSFLYVPAPKTSDPIVKILSFQDNLAILNKNSKWVLSGTDLATFNLRQAIGKNGAASSCAVDSDENYIYYLGSDRHFYRWNGVADEDIGALIQPELDKIPDLNSVCVRAWKNQIRIYYPTSGASSNSRCLIFDKIIQEWLRDTDAYIKRTSLQFKDDNKLVEASDIAGVLYYAEQRDSILGKPISFEYRSKYHSFGESGAKKQIRKMYPLLRSQEAPFTIEVQVDKDLRNQPKSYTIDTQGTGAEWGTGLTYGGGSTYGKTELIAPRLTVSGQAVYFQLRFVHVGADQPIELLGYILYYRTKRPK